MYVCACVYMVESMCMRMWVHTCACDRGMRMWHMQAHNIEHVWCVSAHECACTCVNVCALSLQLSNTHTQSFFSSHTQF